MGVAALERHAPASLRWWYEPMDDEQAASAAAAAGRRMNDALGRIQCTDVLRDPAGPRRRSARRLREPGPGAGGSAELDPDCTTHRLSSLRETETPSARSGVGGSAWVGSGVAGQPDGVIFAVASWDVERHLPSCWYDLRVNERGPKSGITPATGATWADVYLQSQARPKLEAALERLVDWTVDRVAFVEVARRRVLRVFSRVNEDLEAGNTEPIAIPERVVLEVVENVAREERDDLLELWASLLTSAARGMDIDAFHIDIVRKLDPHSAKLLESIAHARYLRVDDDDLGVGRCVVLGLITPGEHPMDTFLRESMPRSGVARMVERQFLAQIAPGTSYTLTSVGRSLALALGLVPSDLEPPDEEL